MRTFKVETEFGTFTVNRKTPPKVCAVYLFGESELSAVPSPFKTASWSKNTDSKYLLNLVKEKESETGLAYNARLVRYYYNIEEVQS